MKTLYLLLAIAGAAVPYVFFTQHFVAQGFLPGAFLGQVTANPAAAGAFADLVISSVGFWVLMAAAGPGGPRRWPFVLLNLAVGLSCALPAYLYLRERRSARG